MMESLKSTITFISSSKDDILALKRIFIHSINLNVYKNKPNAKWIGNFFACILKEEFEPERFICKANVDYISSIYNPVEGKYCFIMNLSGDHPPIHALKTFITSLFKKKIELSYSLGYRVENNVMDMYFNNEDEDPCIVYSSNALN